MVSGQTPQICSRTYLKDSTSPNNKYLPCYYCLNNSDIIIQSKYRGEDILMSDLTPDSSGLDILCYVCPICERYFSRLLVAVCCNNYICHFCATDLSQAINRIEVACPHCRANPILLKDVDLMASIRYYSDSKNMNHLRNELQEITNK